MTNTDSPKKVGVWIRVSTEDQAKGESPQTHEQRARMYAELKGWHVVTVYDLAGISGKSVLAHPEAQRMVADVQAGKIEALIFSRLARLARNTKELLEIAEIFKRCNAALVSLGESLDTSTPAGMLLFTVLGALAEWERSEISARVAASVPIRAAQGKPTGGHGPWGYEWIDRRLEIEPAAAAHIKVIFRIYIEENGNKARAVRRINGAGILTRNGAKWTVTSLTRLLDNTAYIGRRVANYSRSLGESKSWTHKPETEWVYHDIEPVIDEETWSQVKLLQQKRAAEKTTTAGFPKESRYLFGGLLVCECGKKMYMQWVTKKTPTYRCLGCTKRVAESDLVEGLLEVFRRVTIHPELLESKETPVEHGMARQRLDDLAREIERTKKRKAKLIDLYGDERVTKAELFAQLKRLDDDLSAMEQEDSILADKLHQYEISQLNKTPLLEQAESLSNLWHILTYDEQRQVTKELIDSIVVKDRETVFVLYQTTDIGKESHTPRDSSPKPA